MDQGLPFSQACENNKGYILEVLCRHLDTGDGISPEVLEIGSGTGQHGEFFAGRLPALRWRCTDLQENLPGLNRRILAAELENLPPAVELDATWPSWPCGPVGNFFSANSLHIMSQDSVDLLIAGVGRYLSDGGLLMVYGPFKYDGRFTTPSNESFDGWLKQRDPRSGIRDFESVTALATQVGLELLEDNAMPANNQMLVWRKHG